MKETCFEDEPLWYKDAIIYELHVRAFYDSSHDGIGDFRGLTEKLGYLERLGVTAICSFLSIPPRKRTTDMILPTILISILITAA